MWAFSGECDQTVLVKLGQSMTDSDLGLAPCRFDNTRDRGFRRIRITLNSSRRRATTTKSTAPGQPDSARFVEVMERTGPNDEDGKKA